MKTFSDTAQNDMERTMNTLTMMMMMMMMMIVVILMLCFPYGNFPIHRKFCRCEYCCICHFLQNCLVLTLCISQNCKVYLSKLPNVFVQELCGDYIMSPKFVSRTSPSHSPHKLSFVRGNPIDQKLFHPRDRKENIFSLGKRKYRD